MATLFAEHTHTQKKTNRQQFFESERTSQGPTNYLLRRNFLEINSVHLEMTEGNVTKNKLLLARENWAYILSVCL